MGKQITFYMDEPTESCFIDFILDNAKILAEVETASANSIIYIEDKDFFEDKNQCVQFWIYKEELGELDIRETENRKYVAASKSPVIEFSRTLIRMRDKEIIRGRIWVELKYWDETGELVHKSEKLNTLYKALTKWIKKNVSHREINREANLYKEYISDSLVEYIENPKFRVY
ncbi:hypothetical protein ACFVHQ_01495 [Actinomycetes bacterium NPDC127524]